MSISKKRVVAAVALACVIAALQAEPVDVRQGAQIGAGYTFRRGATCTVVTVRHAVEADGAEVRITDRSGGTAIGQRSYDNETYDLALVTLPENSAVACTSSWPEIGWIASAKFNSKSSLEIVRHTPDDRETILPVRYVGGTSDIITLEPIGKMKIQVTFSGSVVRAEEKLLALVQKMNPATGGFDALRFDVIDQLVGSRFKGTSQSGSPVYFAGVYQRDRINVNWTTYVNSWLREKSGHSVVPMQSAARCDIRINVIDWKQKRVPNPQYEVLQRRYDACGTRDLLGGVFTFYSPKEKATCQKQVRAQMNEAGRNLGGHDVTLEVAMTPRNGVMQSKLENMEIVLPPGAGTSQTARDMQVMQEAGGTMLTKLFGTGVCD